TGPSYPARRADATARAARAPTAGCGSPPGVLQFVHCAFCMAEFWLESNHPLLAGCSSTMVDDCVILRMCVRSCVERAHCGSIAHSCIPMSRLLRTRGMARRSLARVTADARISRARTLDHGWSDRVTVTRSEQRKL